MSGGGTRVAKGGMCSSFVSDVSPQQLVEMERKLERNEKANEVIIDHEIRLNILLFRRESCIIFYQSINLII
jgi:hypothetical protein